MNRPPLDQSSAAAATQRIALLLVTAPYTNRLPACPRLSPGGDAPQLVIQGDDSMAKGIKDRKHNPENQDPISHTPGSHPLGSAPELPAPELLERQLARPWADLSARSSARQSARWPADSAARQRRSRSIPASKTPGCATTTAIALMRRTASLIRPIALLMNTAGRPG